jgi:TRAP-type C4-dicarboxylate transport system substrate-binding protein
MIHSPHAMTRRNLLGLSAGLAAAACAPGGADQHDKRLRLRVATDVNTDHVLTRTLHRFLERVVAAFPGEVRVELFHSGQLYYDRDMPRAIMRGDLDMAAPTIMTLSRVVPECAITSLPSFYSQPPAVAHAVTDGATGEELNRRLRASLGVVVPGRYVDLGPIDLFYSEIADAAHPIVGHKIRIPSGAANVLRLRALGGYPVMLPFADVPIALSQRTVDAIESTAETVRTAQLWDAGISACVRNQVMFVQYVPMFSAHLWDRASPRLREGLLGLWAEAATLARVEAAERQNAARAQCAANGVTMLMPSPAYTTATRVRLTALEPMFIERLGIDPAVARAAVQEIA